MATEINKGIEPFEAVTDFTRNNPDRKPWGKSESASALHIGSEYDPIAAPPVEPSAPVAPPVPPPAAKLTHKLENGTTLEADSIDDLAKKIEQALKTPPATPEDFEDKPVYQGYQFTRKDLTLPEQAEILNLWKENPQAALRKLQEAELGATTDKLLEVINSTQMALRLQKEMEAGVEFLGEEETFNPTKGNGDKLTAHLRAKGKPITVHNLRVAFHQLVAAGDKSLLMPVETPAAPPAEELHETPPPPTHMPANLGTPPPPPQSTVDPVAFSRLPLDQQKKFFSDLRRRS